MDVHRCRFVNYPPATINAVAFSKSNSSTGQKIAPPRLAIGRANGDIEIWNPLKGSWFQETIIRGGKDRSVDGLVWTQDPDEEVQGETIIGKLRLFSIGYSATVTEWDLETSKPLRSASGSHAEIWCLAAQPPLAQGQTSKSGQWEGQNLVAGCMDGALVLYSTKDGALELQKVFTRPSAKKAKIVSVVFKDRNIVVAGCSDSTIRIYDIRNGQLLRNMTLGSGPKGGPREIIVWSINVLQNGDIISGDSTGELKIWDGKTFTLTQRIKGHRSDVLSLATGSDGSTIFSGGMDRRTLMYKRSGKKGRWNEVAHRRFHDNDVKTMASFEHDGISVIVSGGPDAAPVVVPLKQFGYENQRALPFLPQEPNVQTSSKRRLLMSWWEREVNVWRIKRTQQSSENAPVGTVTPEGRKLAVKILIRGEANITSAALSEDGKLLAVSTIAEVKLFHLRQQQTTDGDALKVSKIALPSISNSGARLIKFSPDGKWLMVARPDSQIGLLRIDSSNSSITVHPHSTKLRRVDRKISKAVVLGGLGSYDRSISQAAFSSDSRILAVGDLAGYLDTFVLSGREDLTQVSTTTEPSDNYAIDSSDDDESDSEQASSKKPSTSLIFGQHWIRNPQAHLLPRLPSACAVLSFRPDSNTSLHSITNGATPPATRHNPRPDVNELPTGEDRLFVLTSTNDIFEFEVLKGTLSQWSRRNPSDIFSDTFRRNKDLAKGAFWEVGGGKERVWLYSIGWLWMFDLSRDLPAPEDPALTNGANSTPNKKRKRGPERNTGAGSVIPDSKLLTGMSRKMHLAEQDVSSVQYDVFPDTMDIDENDEAEDKSALQLLRRGSKSVQESDGFKHEWHTYKYRPILGAGIISGNSAEDATASLQNGEQETNQKSRVDSNGDFEIVIVERPAFEADMPDRYIGDQEWEKGDYAG